MYTPAAGLPGAARADDGSAALGGEAAAAQRLAAVTRARLDASTRRTLEKLLANVRARREADRRRYAAASDMFDALGRLRARRLRGAVAALQLPRIEDAGGGAAAPGRRGDARGRPKTPARLCVKGGVRAARRAVPPGGGGGAPPRRAARRRRAALPGGVREARARLSSIALGTAVAAWRAHASKVRAVLKIRSLLFKRINAALQRAVAALRANRLLHVAAATRVETVARRALALKTFQAAKDVALRLQTRGRGRRDRLLAVNRRRALAAVRIQTKLRGRAARVAYAAVRRGTLALQSVVRRAMATRRLVRWCRARVARRRFATLVETARRLQHRWRGALWRRCFVGLRAATVTTQTAVRRVHFLKRYGAYRVHAVRVQTVWRGALSKRRFRDARSRVIALQSVARRWSKRRTLFALRFVRDRAGTLIQSAWRRALAVTRVHRLHAERLKRRRAARRASAIVIQARTRGVLGAAAGGADASRRHKGAGRSKAVRGASGFVVSCGRHDAAGAPSRRHRAARVPPDGTRGHGRPGPRPTAAARKGRLRAVSRRSRGPDFLERAAARRRFGNVRHSTIVAQTRRRARTARRAFARAKRAVLVVQGFLRDFVARRRFEKVARRVQRIARWCGRSRRACARFLRGGASSWRSGESCSCKPPGAAARKGAVRRRSCSKAGPAC